MKNQKWPTLFVKTSTGSINYWKIGTSGALVRTEWGQMGTKSPQVEQYEAKGKNIGRANETSPEDQAKLEADSKWKKQKRLKYVESLEDTEKLNIKPMRAYKLTDLKRPLQFPVSVQPKFNGVRCMAYPLDKNRVRLMSRGGKDYCVSRVEAELDGRIPLGECLDGELYAHGINLQTIRHLIDEDSELIQFRAYDMLQLPPGNTPWSIRLQMLCDWFSGSGKGLKHVHLSPTFPACAMEQITAFHDKWVEEGYEGCMVRTMTGVYKLAHKSHDLLKVKNHEDAEFKVIGWSVDKDGIIKYTCVQEEGLEFEVRPMGTDAERAQLLKTAKQDVGKMLTVRYQERTKDNIPFHGRGVAFRGAEDMD